MKANQRPLNNRGLLKYITWEGLVFAFTVYGGILASWYAFGQRLEDYKHESEIRDAQVVQDIKDEYQRALKDQREKVSNKIEDLAARVDANNAELAKEVSTLQSQSSSIKTDVRNINTNVERIFQKLDRLDGGNSAR